MHVLNSTIAETDALPIGSIPDELRLLTNLRRGARLGINGRQRLPVEQWGNLEYLGPDIEAIHRVYSHLELPLDDVYLSDVLCTEFIDSVFLVRLLLDGMGVHQLSGGFVFDAATACDIDDSMWTPCGFRIPLILNLKQNGVVVWVEGTGSLYVEDGLKKGFRPEAQFRWASEVRSEPFAHVTSPEIWFYEEWPPIPIHLQPKGQGLTTKYEGQLPFAGETFELPE